MGRERGREWWLLLVNYDVVPLVQVGTSRLLVSPPGEGGEDEEPLPLDSASCQVCTV